MRLGAAEIDINVAADVGFFLALVARGLFLASVSARLFTQSL